MTQFLFFKNQLPDGLVWGKNLESREADNEIWVLLKKKKKRLKFGKWLFHGHTLYLYIEICVGNGI